MSKHQVQFQERNDYKSVKDGVEALRLAYESGINYYDLAAAQADAFSCVHESLGDVRKEVLYH